MEIVFVNQFYVPDSAPTGQYLHDVARGLVSRGHEVTVLCSRGSYGGTVRYPRNEVMDGVNVQRLSACSFGRRNALHRVSDYASFSFLLLMRLLFRRQAPALVVSLTTPPFIGGAVALAGVFRRYQQAHWIMDLYPDVLAANGTLKSTGLLYKLLSSVMRRLLRASAMNVVLGPSMRLRVAAYTGGARPPACCPLWVPAALRAECAAREVEALREERGWSNDVVFMYSGNMGLGHRFAEFLKGAAATSDLPGIRWVFSGEGCRRGEVEAFAAANPGASVELLDAVTPDRLSAHLQSADVHLVSLDDRWTGCMVSSKLQGSFVVGRPVLFVGDAASTVAGWIRESGGGWTVEPGDVEGVTAAAREAMDQAERNLRGRAARQFAQAHFDAVQNIDRMCDLFESVLPGREGQS